MLHVKNYITDTRKTGLRGVALVGVVVVVVVVGRGVYTDK